MKNSLNVHRICLAIFVAICLGTASFSFAQESPDDAKPAAKGNNTGEPDDAAGKDAEEEEVDPFAVPEDADAKQLFDFIQTAKSNRGRTLQTVLKSAKAVVAASEKIRGLDDVSSEDEMKALREELTALRFVVRYDKEAKDQLGTLIESLRDDERPEFQRIARIEGLSARFATLRDATTEELQATVDELKEVVGEGAFDRELYGLGNSLARAITGPENVDIAAGLYEYMAVKMAASDDEMLNTRAVKMEGAARRVRLPGNAIEIVCPTDDGKALDWDSYRGKVVLVDFWASWCGPCRGEIPNMKRNLQAYGSDSFDIVGVNLDRTKKAMDKYVEENELSWTNLISDDPSTMGWDNPMATYYGIMSIPTAILVDQKGQVVSMRARGAELDRLLVELLGEPKKVEEESGADEDAEPENADEKEKS